MSVPASVACLLEVFDVRPAGPGRFVGVTGPAGTDGRQVAKGAQALGQAIVATAKRFPDKAIRSAHAIFTRPVEIDSTVELSVDVVHEGRSTATAVLTVSQDSRLCATVTVLADVPSGEVISHHALRPDVDTPDDAHPAARAMAGHELRLVDVVDVNSPDEVGPPELYAWLRCDPIPERDDLAKALLAYFTGQLGISTTMRPHRGVGTAQAHATLSTALMSTSVCFHEVVEWDGWLLYSHESTAAAQGMSYVRGQVHTEDGELLASFAQEGLIRPMRPGDTAIDMPARL
ncbi:MULTISPECIES: acyl-CoA thioesterase II [unclassified Mycolicibacterium]|uniref:acyl-CoA thioesterase n=1 Tax=unclassified Mycolicibacterium TaxID=2636767 RepID=UPI0012DDBE46|nr:MULTISPECIES: acyl-CoA thioesterase domain-containing protein [unclassified Mycolicibacterium]MUL80441.1 thioesterase family protein [Mycolicibacterium sp. CBMA 329]MUL86208.1 thioesterase family protein [Mycolicibacterium sp. CBMA 331]MUM01129.1 thioesterase family protein [Mycolicibacterium sp. CBMA 334]MUM25023.1 thioesterase family protein [Mycolicibacterium sp. CBMA 295]MUM36504.1 thioesterase family protein [Mycolicibacterium sp. CBMA 247]